MLCLESSFLVDWFRGQDYAETYLESVDADTPLLVPTLVLYELFIGTHHATGSPESVSAIYHALENTEFVGFTADAAEDAAEIRVTLTKRGEAINAVDILIGAVARNAGATLIATDGHFDRIDGLRVHNPHPDA